MKENRRKIMLAIGQAVMLYIVYAIVSALAFWNLQTDSFDRNIGDMFWSRKLYFQVAYVYGMIAFFSLASVFTLHDSALRERFSKVQPNSMIGSCVLLATDRLVWVRCALLGTIAALFNFFPPHYFFHAAFVMGKETVEAWLWGAFSVILFVLVYLLAVLSTLNWWSMVSKKHVESKSGIPAFLFQLGYTSALWVLGGYLLAVVLPITSGFFKLVYRYLFLFLLVAVIALLIYSLYRYGNVMWQRRKLLRGLAHECKQQGLSFELDGHPYLGLLYQTRPCTVTIQGNNAKYVCQFVGGIQAKNPLYLHDNGNAEYTLFYIWWSHVITERYFFEASEDAKKILLVCPSRGKVFAKNDEAETELYLSDRVMGYTLYTGQSFLNALRRKSV